MALNLRRAQTGTGSMPVVKNSIQTKSLFYIVVILILLGGILTSVSILQQKSILVDEFKKRGLSISEGMATSSTLSVLLEDKTHLNQLVTGALKHEDVRYSVIQNKKGNILAIAGTIEPGEIFKDNANAGGSESGEKQLARSYLSKKGEPIYDTVSFIKTQRKEKMSEEIVFPGEKEKKIEEKPGMIEEIIGVAQVGISLTRMNEEIGRFRRTAIWLTLIVIMLAILGAIFLIRMIVNPIRQLVLGTQKIARGDLTYRVEVKSKDEIGDLAQSFNQMTGELKKSRDEIENYSRTLEEKVEERTKELKGAQAQLVQSAKLAAVGQLGAGIAHELNNPLGGILGYSQFMLEKFTRPEFNVDDFKACQRYIESIERESTRCKKIVENLLKFSRKPISAKPESLDIARAIKETLSIIGHQLKLKNIKVITELKPDLLEVAGIVNQLQQVFTNLILNAQQAMPEGGELRITGENMIDEGARIPHRIKIEFADSGCGIPAENLPRIFEPFFTTKQKDKGTGLGLSVSYQIIHDHKGTIELRSEVGKGTTFTIALPTLAFDSEVGSR